MAYEKSTVLLQRNPEWRKMFRHIHRVIRNFMIRDVPKGPVTILKASVVGQ